MLQLSSAQPVWHYFWRVLDLEGVCSGGLLAGISTNVEVCAWGDHDARFSYHVQIRWRSKRRNEDQKRALTNYLKNFERLLSLLTRSIQDVQEREIVYHGYLRWGLRK